MLFFSFTVILGTLTIAFSFAKQNKIQENKEEMGLQVNEILLKLFEENKSTIFYTL